MRQILFFLQTFGWVDQPGDYLNLLTYLCKNPDLLALGLVSLTYSRGPGQTVRGGHDTCFFLLTPKPRHRYAKNYLINKYRFASFYLRRPLLRLREIYPLFLFSQNSNRVRYRQCFCAVWNQEGAPCFTCCCLLSALSDLLRTNQVFRVSCGLASV